jgi:hypothetical protein
MMAAHCYRHMMHTKYVSFKCGAVLQLNVTHIPCSMLVFKPPELLHVVKPARSLLRWRLGRRGPCRVCSHMTVMTCTCKRCCNCIVIKPQDATSTMQLYHPHIDCRASGCHVRTGSMHDCGIGVKSVNWQDVRRGYSGAPPVRMLRPHQRHGEVAGVVRCRG